MSTIQNSASHKHFNDSVYGLEVQGYKTSNRSLTLKNNQFVYTVFLIFFLLLKAGISQAQPTSKETIYHAVMKEELTRNMQGLQLPNAPKPCYTGLLLTEGNNCNVSASLGTLSKSEVYPINQIRIENMAIGTYEVNNLHFDINNYQYYYREYDKRLPLQPSPFTIRMAIWELLDKQYKEAANLFQRKETFKAQKKVSEEILRLQDWEKKTATKVNETEISTTWDKQPLEELAKKASAVLKNPSIISSSVTISGVRSNEYYQNTEGIQATFPVQVIRITMNARALTPDGQEKVERYEAYFSDLTALPDPVTLTNHAKEMVENLLQTIQAPIFDDLYEGPVLFEGQAAAEFINQSFFSLKNSNNLLANRPWLIEETRYSSAPAITTGLEERLGRVITSKSFSLYARSSQKTMLGVPCIGYYPIDKEGVTPPNELVLIENGFLRNFLAGRAPTTKVNASNGHARLTNTRNNLLPGVVEARCTETIAHDSLKTKLLALAESYGLSYAIIIRKLGYGNTNLRQVYRVDVNTGQETLIRSAILDGISYKLSKRLVCASDKNQVYNTTVGSTDGYIYSSLGGTPATFVTPAGFIVDDMEIVKDKNPKFQKMPVAPNPVE